MMRRCLTTGALAVLVLVSACSDGREGQGDGEGNKVEAAPAPPPALPMPETVSSRPDAGAGEKLYLAKCAMCHGAGGMGTGLLARRVEEPLLEKRTDMDRDFVVQAARMGIGNMPAIPRGEVSDGDLNQIAEYLVGRKEVSAAEAEGKVGPRAGDKREAGQ